MKIFDSFPSSQYDMIKPLTTEKDHILRYRYTPQPDINTRLIIDRIKSVDPSFKVSILRQESLEERGEKVHRAELKRIARRLALCVVIAIPTFIIGIVFMSLLSSNHPLRQWAEKPIWAGEVTRAEWALLILATPVYFFAADLFHARALAEIKGLWSKQNPKPIWTKFVKFGSMNMLVSDYH